jgi:hypothetical protein
MDSPVLTFGITKQVQEGDVLVASGGGCVIHEITSMWARISAAWASTGQQAAVLMFGVF